MKKITLIIILAIGATRILSSQPVDINNADVAQIALLPGIGRKLAENIVAYRKRHGSLLRAHDLLSVPGLTDKKLAKIDKHIVFIQRKAKSMNNDKTKDSRKILLPKKPLISLAVLEAHVLKVQGLDLAVDRSFSTRVRKAAFLPKLSAYVDLDRADVTAERKTDNVSDSLQKRGGRDVGIGVRATFDLDKLIYNSDEIEVAKLSLKRLEIRDEIINKLQKNYFHYVRLRNSAQNPIDVELAATMTLEMEEIEAALDSLSDGKFTKFMMVETANDTANEGGKR